MQPWQFQWMGACLCAKLPSHYDAVLSYQLAVLVTRLMNIQSKIN